MNRIGDSWGNVDWSIVSPFPEEVEPTYVCEQEEFDFLSEKPFPFSKRAISPPVSPEKTDKVFNSRKQKHVEENDPAQKKQKNEETTPAPLKATEKDSRQKALEQIQALLRDYPPEGAVFSPVLAKRYQAAINLKFPDEFNTFKALHIALTRYEHKYGRPCPDVSLDSEIAAAFVESNIPQETKEKAMGIIKACLIYQSDFGLKNYIDITCQLLGVEAASDKAGIEKFYQSNKDQYPAAEWTAELQEQITLLMEERFSDVFIDEVLGQYAALKNDPLAIAILAKAYNEEFKGKIASPYARILKWIKNRPLPENTPPLHDKVKQVAETISRQVGQKPSLQESEIKSVVGHVKACLKYFSNPPYLNEIFKLTKADCNFSGSIQTIQRYYNNFKTKHPIIPLSQETKLKLIAMKDQSNEAEGVQSKRNQALKQYGALLTHTKSRPSPKHFRYLNVINNKWPGAFSSIHALISAYRRAPKKAPLDPDIQKAFDEPGD